MLFSSDDAYDSPAIEAVLWTLAAALAVWRALPSPPGSRFGWWLFAICFVVFAGDKVFDLHGMVHHLCREAAVALDPEHQLRGPNAIYRNAVLAVVFLAGCIGLWLGMRRDEHFGRGKLFCIGSIVVVAGIVTERLVPQLQGVVPDLLLKILEAIAWVLAIGGLMLGRIASPAHDSGASTRR